jgi:hypothetical protein
MDEHTHIIGSCPECGQMRLPVEAFTIRGCPDDDVWSYRFTCPECHHVCVDRTSAERALQAIEIGADLETWDCSSVRREQRDGPAFTASDLIELRHELAEPDWFDRFVRAGAAGTA